jgi:hypothetical protein
MRKTSLLTLTCFCLAIVGCSRSNNLLMGKIEATVGTHPVVVTDCYRTSVDPPQKLNNTPDGGAVYRFTPCRDADIWIRGEVLEVNGKTYGHLNPSDSILVDHSVVSVIQNVKRSAM